ncbi:protein of unknown function [Xenorhabdus poinarii G6]|uniref:Uncharacterized protein n=1 Tax=Xenorhabdus poinarii G6 TaxID=1354304 RepID=A0A068QZ95_9GAMM|nr:protein of unknown function [Xenorhabdus poinarii G6]
MLSAFLSSPLIVTPWGTDLIVTPCVIEVNPTVGHNFKISYLTTTGIHYEQRRPAITHQTSH